VAEAEVRLKVDGPPLPAKPKKMRKEGAGPDIDLAAAAALRERMKGSNDHVSRPDYYPNLDHLD
jgi:hypothetical protein